MKKFIFRLSATVILFLILTFYLWTASTTYNSPFKFNFSRDLGKVGGYYDNFKKVGFYNALSDSFLAGHLHLLINPPEKLLKLSNPYDPLQNGPLNQVDFSLYKNKYYLYYGPAPVVTLFIPFQLIFGTGLPQELACAIFCFGGFFFSWLLFLFLIKRFLPDTPDRIIITSEVVLGLGNLSLYILRWPDVYQVAVAAGYFFVFSGLFWLVSGLYGHTPSDWKLALGSLMLGLAVGSRPHFILWGAFLIYILFKFSGQKPTNNYRPGGLIKEALIVLGPFILCLGLLALYNYVRFNNIFEFGLRYIMGYIDKAHWKTFNWAYLPFNFFIFLCQPFNIQAYFPFVVLSRLSRAIILPAGYVLYEPVPGLLLLWPFIWLIFGYLIFYKRFSSNNRALWQLLGFCLLEAGALLFVTSLLTVFPTVRYQMDFLPILLFCSLIIWAGLQSHFPIKMFRKSLLNFFIYSAIIFSCLGNILIGFYGTHSFLKINRPDIYFFLARHFPSPPHATTIAEEINLKLIMPAEPLTVLDLLEKGAPQNKTRVYIRSLGNKQYQIGLAGTEKYSVLSRPFLLKPGRPVNIKIFWGNSFNILPIQPWRINFCFISVNRREIISGQNNPGSVINSPLVLADFWKRKSKKAPSDNGEGEILRFMVTPAWF